MLIWIALLIPVLTTGVLFFLFNKKVRVWEFIIPFVASFLFVFLAKICVEVGVSRDVEFWGGSVDFAQFDEAWNERVFCTHTKRCEDAKGRSYSCGTEHIYDVEEHPRSWKIRDSNGIFVGINKKKYKEIVEVFGEEVFKDMKRSYHTKDGDRYVTTWDGTQEKLISVTTKHTYENRVAVSDSVFSYEPVKDTKGLVNYPKIKSFYHLPAILGKGDDGTREEAERILQVANAEMGRIKQIRFFLILLGPGTSVSDGLRQEAFWKGGNKNELNVVLGVSKEGKPEWAHVFSWTPVESLKVDIREAVFETKSLAELTTKIVSLAEEKWVRKSFSEFSYLTVNPPKHAIYFTFFLAVVVNFLSAVWVINNEY